MFGTMVAVGDSFTERLWDGSDEPGPLVGWADRVALALSHRHEDLRYANLAVRGKLLDEIVRDQVPGALDFEPDLLTFHGGRNDVQRPGGRGGRRPRLEAPKGWLVRRRRR